MRNLTLTCLVLALGACGSKYVVTKDGTTEAEFKRDAYECTRDAFGGRTPYYGVVEEFAAKQMALRCMTDGKGYTLVEKK